MKKAVFLLVISFAICFSFSSCTREVDSLPVDENKAYLSFHILLNDQNQKQQNKQVNNDIPACTEGVPAFIDIILNNADPLMADPVTTPLRLKLNPGATNVFADGATGYFNGESTTIGLAPGTYLLEYCTVLDDDGNVLWVAPINDHEPGGIDDLIQHSLPMEINLNSGSSKAQEVEVVCFDNRSVNQYGYFFYELNEIKVNEFCIFGTFCEETGRHAEFIHYRVDVWKFSGDHWAPKGELLHEDLQNSVVVTDNAEQSEVNSYPLCFTLPDGPGMDKYYLEITRIHSGTDDGLIRSGLISDAEVRGLFRENGTMDYYHFREGNCNMDDGPVLLGDQRDLLGSTWQFTFYFGDDSGISADVDFYENGTASYRLYGDPDYAIIGTWTYLNDHLYYDPDGGEEILGFKVSGTFDNGRLSGTYWRHGVPDQWTAFRKTED